LVTNKSQVKKIVLPDQSIVWLNNNSEISFDQNLNQQKVRKVKLRGEAFFEVQPDPARPFQVETPHGLIEVLGTSFNVRGLKTEPQTEVQVMHGLVALQGKEKKARRIKVPANFVGFISTSTGQVSKDLTQNKQVFASTQAWRTRKIKLEQRTLAEAQEIMRRYTHYRLEFSDPHLATCVFTWTLQLDKPEASLQLLAQGGIFQLQRTSPDVFRLVGKACPK
jgi:ferric-dicitrate binding protein FerR (iron transport regulator)